MPLEWPRCCWPDERLTTRPHPPPSIFRTIGCYLYDPANDSYHLLISPYVVCAHGRSLASEFMPVYVIGLVLVGIYLLGYPLGLAYVFFSNRFHTR